MATSKVIGDDVVQVAETRQDANGKSYTVTLAGLYDNLVYDVDPEEYAEDGYYFDSQSFSTDGDGTCKLVLTFKESDNSAASLSASRVTYRVEMAEVVTALQNHPYFEGAGVRNFIDGFLVATERGYDTETEGWWYKDAKGLKHTTDSQLDDKFCKAYTSGITTYNRYFPIVERISIYKRPPGMTVGDRGSMSGNPTFSANIGTFDTCPLTLSGYASTGWFKSKDSWVQSADKTWTRTEQWTYTPDGSTGDHAWIYASSSASNNASS